MYPTQLSSSVRIGNFSILFFLICFVPLQSILASGTDTPVQEAGLYGSLMLPKTNQGSEVVLIIAGSGPTDRNGNQRGMSNDCYLWLAKELANQGVASLRYDKRGVGESQGLVRSESELRLEHYVEDAARWVTRLAADKRFSRVFVLGHSEGSLIGMLACQKSGEASGFISVAGPGRSGDELLKEQLAGMPDYLKQTVYSLLDKLKKGESISEIPESLYTLFRPSVQPYLTSWFRYNPVEEIRKCTIPVMIVQGTTDIQVTVHDSELLGAAVPDAHRVVISNMNHVLKMSESVDQRQQLRTYTTPELPLHPQLADELVSFVRSVKE